MYALNDSEFNQLHLEPIQHYIKDAQALYRSGLMRRTRLASRPLIILGDALVRIGSKVKAYAALPNESVSAPSSYFSL